MRPAIFIWVIDALWFVLVVYLTVSAIGVKQETKGHLWQSFGLMFAIIAAFLLPHLPLFHFLNFAPVNPILSSAGVILCAAGMIFLLWGRQCLGRNWSQTVAVKKGHELVTSGPYRYLRHPMYAGGLLACIGSAIVAGGPWIFLLVILGALFLWRVGAEDRLMAQQFPNEYPDYKKRTKALIPFVW
ncbi:MAG TPA: isoprenylcysteine carboxylmethyltransferase family protein [Chthoniobacterales bacterium]|nr:isoprenylcysteine carboxylmethyltransferase family protein [Chthoniobacterales bacterium]